MQVHAQHDWWPDLRGEIGSKERDEYEKFYETEFMPRFRVYQALHSEETILQEAKRIMENRKTGDNIIKSSLAR